jgi:hypothetical protein
MLSGRDQVMAAPGVALAPGAEWPTDYEAYRRAYGVALRVMLAARDLPGTPPPTQAPFDPLAARARQAARATR